MVQALETRGAIRLKSSRGFDLTGKEQFKYNQFSGLKPEISNDLVYEFKTKLEEVQKDGILEVNRQRNFQLEG